VGAKTFSNWSTAHNTGRVAVITGASSGIGAATARALVAEDLGNGSIAIQADVTDREQLVIAFVLSIR
jgi:NAD(P)-dependent dehydrogenase (short-subunit alcohol dehydrogenase family)